MEKYCVKLTSKETMRALELLVETYQSHSNEFDMDLISDLHTRLSDIKDYRMSSLCQEVKDLLGVYRQKQWDLRHKRISA